MISVVRTGLRMSAPLCDTPHLHRLVHLLAIWPDLLVLQARLHQIQREHAGYTDDASDAAIDDFWQ